jgi:copper chaperone CopZ
MLYVIKDKIMKTIIISFIFCFSVASVALAQETHEMNHSHSHEHIQSETNHQASAPLAMKGKACENVTEIQVNGLVCDFCARAIEKVFGRQDGVKAVDVNLDEGRILVSTDPGASLEESTIRSLVEDAGYSPTSIERGC